MVESSLQQPVRSWLRLEALAVSAAGVLLWAGLDGGWWRFALLLLVPDVSMLAYVAGPRVGAAVYNVAHSFLVPVVLGVAGGMLDHRGLLLASALWLTHIGIDRALGMGLKYPSGFQDTHLGRVGGVQLLHPLQQTGEGVAGLLKQPDGSGRVPLPQHSPVTTLVS